jgi:hypothetical protein
VTRPDSVAPVRRRTETRAIEANVDPTAVVAVLADGRRAPEWAPGFADQVEGDGQSGWTVTKDGERFGLRIVVDETAGTVDYLRAIAPGEEGGAYLRATPRPGGGSVVTINVPVGPNADAATVGATIEAELEAIVGLVTDT